MAEYSSPPHSSLGHNSGDDELGSSALATTVRASSITAPSNNDKQDIQNIVRLWDLNTLDKGMRQGTWVEFPKNPGPNDYKPHRSGWRIDNQKNGSFPIGNLQYYTFAVQNGSPVYSNIQVPYLYYLGMSRIRNAFLMSMDKTKTARIIFPAQSDKQPPSQESPEARETWVQSLNWRLEYHD